MGSPSMYRLVTLVISAILCCAIFLTACGGGTKSDTSTPSPSPDFSLSVSPASVTLQAGGSGSDITVTAAGVNSFSASISVSISGLPSGVTASPASLSLTPGTSKKITLTASSSTGAATANITFTGTASGSSHPASVALTVQAASQQQTSGPAPDITTFHDNNSRDGLNAQETTLTLANVNSTQFGKVGFDTVDGKVDAEPLFLAGVNVGGSTHNVLYVATEHDSVYAFDADAGTQLWKTSVLGSGETTSDDRSCGQVGPEIGITATPVIDRKQGANGTIYVVAMSKDSSGNYHHRLHALDISTGSEVSGSPTEIAATYPGNGDGSSNGTLTFDPKMYKDRAALLLSGGNIYLGWSSHCDFSPYTGWVMGYSESSLQQTSVLNLTPNGGDGSIWMSGDGIAADSGGNLFLLDANGKFDTTLDANHFPSKSDFGNSILKLTTASGKLSVADYFVQFDTISASGADLDLGSGGVVLLPDVTDSAGAARHLLVGGGKDQNLYVADRDNLGRFNAGGSDNSNLYQELPGVGSIFSTPAFFNNVLYLGTVGSPLRAFPMTNGKLATSASSKTAVSFGYPGTSPAVSANGTQNGIVWALESGTGSPAVLHAYDATDLAKELYNSKQAAGGRDSFGDGNKFITPLVVNGKVYVGTPSGVAVFGLLGK
jgi:hypothetical protein